MTYEPAAPAIIRRPEQIADETWLIHQVQEALGAPLRLYLNSMVIRGAEPVNVDTRVFDSSTDLYWAVDASPPDQAMLDAIVSQLPPPEPDMSIGIGRPEPACESDQPVVSGGGT